MSAWSASSRGSAVVLVVMPWGQGRGVQRWKAGCRCLRGRRPGRPRGTQVSVCVCVCMCVCVSLFSIDHATRLTNEKTAVVAVCVCVCGGVVVLATVRENSLPAGFSVASTLHTRSVGLLKTGRHKRGSRESVRKWRALFGSEGVVPQPTPLIVDFGIYDMHRSVYFSMSTPPHACAQPLSPVSSFPPSPP